MIFTFMKSLKAMDAYIIVKEFFDDVDTMVSNTISPTKIKEQAIFRNTYVRLASCSVFAGLLITEIINYRIHQTHRLSIRNALSIFKHKRFSSQRLKHRNVDKTMYQLFVNSIAIMAIGLTTKSNISVGLIMGSNVVALFELLYKSNAHRQNHAIVVFKLAGAVLTVAGLLEGVILCKSATSEGFKLF